MKNTLKNRIVSGFMVLVLIISTVMPGVMAFEEEDFESSLYEVMSEATETAEVKVLSSSDDSQVEVATDSDAEIEAEEGLEILENYTISEREESSDETLYVKVEQDEDISLQPEESLALYSVEDDKIEDVIIEDISEEEEPCEIDEELIGLALVKDSGYRHLNFDLDSVTLDGMMPKDAKAETKDVTEQFSTIDEASETEAEESIIGEATLLDASATDADGISSEGEVIAAYDITIMDGETEYQPSEYRPIEVSITDSQIKMGTNLHIYHIKDNGEQEEITDFTVEDGKVTFSAVGFSIYKLVKKDEFSGNSEGWRKITSLDQLDNFGEGSDGLYISHINGYYFKDSTYIVKDSRKGILKTDSYDNTDVALSRGAVPYYFEKSGNGYYIYCKDGETKKYIKQSGNSLDLVETKSDARVFTISKFNTNSTDVFKALGSDGYYLNMQGGTGGKGFAAHNVANDVNAQLNFWYYKYEEIEEDDPYKLNDKTYGIMNYTGGTHGYALMGESNSVHSLVQLVTRQINSSDGQTLFVDEGSEVTRWTFHNTSKDNYTLSAEIDGTTKYLAVNGTNLTLVDLPAEATSFRVVPNENKEFQLKVGTDYVSFHSEEVGNSTNNSFILSNTPNNKTYLSLVDFAELSEEEMITYSADRISVSDIKDGQKVIVYTRLWDEVNKRYDIYAIDYNGTLYPCYASGGKILWLGDGTCSLEWEFTEYLDEITKEPNYYYELYNPYSEKYIAPQLNGDQVLSEDPIGINLQGRRYGEFYSNIIAWDNNRYAYIGMKAVDIYGSDGKKKLVPCSESASIPFYFATLEELNLGDRLHEVSTVDNNDYGISMKMFDFNGSATDLPNSDVTKNYFKGQTGEAQNLLYTNLEYNEEDSNDKGYPRVRSTDKSFRDMYAGATDVNHLFIESIYNSSGYFEFDSCQNFATLQEKGNGDFTVYRELGTTNASGKNTLKHGQFFPYNKIKVGEYSTSNPENLYSMEALLDGKDSGKLDENDPRKYEKLHLISNPDYFFGMEMSASFVQTVNGLDSWGHDIIFEFTGDDDFWLYVDGELIIDLGGIHSAEGGSVNFRTGEVILSRVIDDNKKRIEERTTLVDIFRKNYKDRGMSDSDIEKKIKEVFDQNEDGQYIFRDYSSHTMRVFYMERGAGASNLHMKFNLAAVTPGNVVVSKKVTGDGAESLDKDFLEYPFQIYYITEDHPGQEQLLGNDNENIMVSYQNSNQPVRYAQTYKPPGLSESEALSNVYFINPTKNAEISFPDKTINYRIVECAVDTRVYNVLINGEPVPQEQQTALGTNGNLISYSSVLDSAENKPTLSFDNNVNSDVVRDLRIKKILTDENGNEITNDPATFSFRLRLSSVDVGDGEIPLADMYNYYVLSPNNKICRYQSGGFVETNLDYTLENINAVKNNENPDYGVDDITFKTSSFGAISNIPAGYTICVPGLPAGTVFNVTEDIKTGYGLIGYQMEEGYLVNSEGETIKIASYEKINSTDKDNTGRILQGVDASLIVENRKGYGYTVKKNWSDLDITTAHSSIYVAVYVDGEFLDGSVRKIESPKTSAYYFWSALVPKDDGTPRTDFDDYEVKEVELTGNPTVAEDGTVTGYTSITPLEEGDEITLTATRTEAATPAGETRDKDYEYVVSYDKGTTEGSICTDTITNTRKGGIAVRLYKWETENPLKGGKFTITDSNGNKVGTFTSDASGLVTMMYSFDRNQLYTLTEVGAPSGYVGLDKSLKFKVNDDDSVSLFYNDGTTEWGDNDVKDRKWANYKPGENGIVAYVDVYNKPFNFKIMKMDSLDSEELLTGAHFALYKQAKTTISGYVKNKDPMTGFEDLVTVNGEVEVCGEQSGRVIRLGDTDSVYFLTETQAPPNYAKMDKDIMFKISPSGRPSLIENEYSGQLVETDDSFIYTLSVPNIEESDDIKVLSITKNVSGNMGDKTKDFEFTFVVPEGDSNTEYDWYVNGILQTDKIKSNEKFSLSHGENVIIMVPAGTKVTISENSENYTSSFILDTETEAEKTNSKTFTVTDSTYLTVTNTLEAIIPTGIWNATKIMIISGLCLIIILITMIIRSRRLKKYASEDE